MASIEVYRNGIHMKTIERPIHKGEDGSFEVTYKGQRYAVLPGNRIEVGSSNALPPVAQSLPPAAPVVQPATILPPVEDDIQMATQQAIVWTDDQKYVIEAAPDARIIVDAGPGTGKTAVACARIAHLIKAHVTPANIWLVSFTRTAVKELRDRISMMTEADESVSNVRIATLDSHTWYLLQGFDKKAERAFQGYEQSIESAHRLMEHPSEELREFLGGIEHLVVDEAQDIVGVRREFLLRLLKLLPGTTGITVLSDLAQSIYGFTDEEEEGSDSAGEPLTDTLRTGNLGFVVRPLIDVKRTRSIRLSELFTVTRRKVLNANNDLMHHVRSDVERAAAGKVPMALGSTVRGATNALILFRRRSEVILNASFLAAEGLSFRVRMSDLPVLVQPWLGVCLRDHTDPALSLEVFERRWNERVSIVTWSAEGLNCWRRLVEVAGRTARSVSMADLRRALGRAQPPIQFVNAEVGTGSVVVGTIHASKGREAEDVYLMLSETSQEGAQKEEARVVYVGATRARRALYLGPATGSRAKSLKKRRVFRFTKDGKGVQVEFGRSGDIDTAAQVAKRDIEAASAEEGQLRLAIFAGAPLRLTAEVFTNRPYRRRLTDAGGTVWGFLSESVDQDLIGITHEGKRKKRPSNKVHNVFAIGAGTIVRRPDDPELALMHEPYASSGIYLVPVIFGFPKVGLYDYK